MFVKYPDQTDRFIRGTLTIKIYDYCEDLEYGIWVPLSKKNFQDYSENFGNPNHQATYFGWFSNDIPEYEISEDGIPTTVLTRQNGLRPEIVPHRDFDHQLVQDYYEGITKAEAEKRIQDMLKVISERDKEIPPSKPWWKL